MPFSSRHEKLSIVDKRAASVECRAKLAHRMSAQIRCMHYLVACLARPSGMQYY
jgi:hypothetical protein